MISDARLHEIAGGLVAVDGVVAVLLGGSRARGEHARLRPRRLRPPAAGRRGVWADRVQAARRDARGGRHAWHAQVGRS